MTGLNVKPYVYVSSSVHLNNAAESFYSEIVTQMGALSGTGGMGGSVGPCQQWSTSYDETAMSVYRLAGALADALHNYACILQQAGYNYALSDHNSGSGRPEPLPPTPLLPARTTCPEPPPSAGGPGKGLIDDGFELASKAGIPIPDGDPDKLLAAAGVWEALKTSNGVHYLPAKLEKIAQSFETVTAPDVQYIDEDIREMKTAAEDLIATIGDLAQSCRDQKAAIDDLRKRLEDILVDLGVALGTELVETVVLGAIAGALTVGYGAAAVTAYKTGKIADKVRDYAKKIGDLVRSSMLKTFVKVAKPLGVSEKNMQRIIDLVKKRGDDVEDAAKSALRSDLDNAQVWTNGILPVKNGPPNGYLVKRDANGNITNYSFYDSDGIATSRVDLTGKPHLDKKTGTYIPTPHVVDVQKNVNPKTGEIFARTLSDSVRPAQPGEIP
ncbi:hypothetical protein IU510_17870 [Nocardia cyriacigeorgica]|uniref:polymorphic toxin type 24 domain-containing protein n=1 Tax=Nocardia cyriacigeorgica TaxID=135487 RepID=UPI001895D1FC|nr:polymorphic toxin type 24 domain-containing protein [Nocardia cyriacigeorgica]MBF6099935.1 hypothetical protein [Nocardia cyriacigeorgica]MBF6316063.1 hypothetical protein [Nocardia cyriacigeorgica]MBF6342394.1 hypothetical protein [Nocardia cyriacigeorgica]MBF6530848.1 hypothetical protein [Nocardia cyriacigeorgica]